MSPLSFTYMAVTGSFSGTQCSTLGNLRIVTQIFTELFHADVLCTRSKEESGFMAVPLVHKGVVVVAVEYDIAPKGKSNFICGKVETVLREGRII